MPTSHVQNIQRTWQLDLLDQIDCSTCSQLWFRLFGKLRPRRRFFYPPQKGNTQQQVGSSLPSRFGISLSKLTRITRTIFMQEEQTRCAFFSSTSTSAQKRDSSYDRRTCGKVSGCSHNAELRTMSDVVRLENEKC